jgi:uncharacterized lipoprotein YmbA
MKKLFVIIAMAALASCGGSAPVDSTATDSAAAAAPADTAAQAK